MGHRERFVVCGKASGEVEMKCVLDSTVVIQGKQRDQVGFLLSHVQEKDTRTVKSKRSVHRQFVILTACRY